MGMYFSISELNPHNLPASDEQVSNLTRLISVLDPVRGLRGKSMIVISGLRDAELQAKVNPLNPGSNHIKGLAADIYDEGGDLLRFVLQPQTLDLLLIEGVYMEDPNWTHHSTGFGWVHFQCVRPASGHRFFVPNASPALSNYWNGVYDKDKYDT